MYVHSFIHFFACFVYETACLFFVSPKAKELKDEMNDLRKEIETMINEVDISALYPEELEQQRPTSMVSTRSNAQQFPSGMFIYIYVYMYMHINE